MSEFDFDELDKAVTSLMGKAVSTDPDDLVVEKNLNISSTLKPGEKPVYDRLGEAAKRIGSETLLTEGEHTVMGDSKLPTTELPIAELNAIQSGQDLNEMPALPIATIPITTPAVQRPNSGRSMDVVRSSPIKRTTTMPSLAAPDRLSSSAPTELKPESADIEEPSLPVVSDASEPQRLTPFLPDTKVEKRPLGTSSDSIPPVGAVESPFATEKQKEDTTSLDTHSDVDATDTQESDRNKDDGQKVLDATEQTSKPSLEDQQLLAVESAEVVEDTPSAESVRAVESGDTEKLSTGSISQQYQVKPTDSPDAAGAIYDVKDYHQALGHPKKQKSGWGTVVLIVVIIVACALIGAAVYFILGAGL